MAYDNLCMYCFEDRGGESVCPHCGRDSNAAVPQIQLLPGSLVYNGRFLVGRALGQDATGIVYAAYDTRRDSKLRIREYLPRDCAERLNDGGIVPIAGREDQFDAGLKKLRASVNREQDPKKRHFFFEENGTAYIAQRKNAAGASSASSASADPDDDDNGRARMVIIAIIATVVVILAAILLIKLFNGALSSDQDLPQAPTLDPNQVWIPAESPTPTPYVAPTFAALVDPDLSWMDYTYEGDVEADYQRQVTPTPRITLAPSTTTDYRSVSRRSSAADIRALQQSLVTLGWLDYTGITGEYDDATKQAVKDFQSYINKEYRPAEPLTVDGQAGPKTLRWLDETKASRPTATPTPMITASPADTGVIDANSSTSQIRTLQRALMALGILPEGNETGRYDQATAAAVRAFQTEVNRRRGFDVLEVTGKVDSLTYAYLRYYVEQYQARVTATPEITATPSPTPVATDTPEPASTSYETNATVDANSSAEDIKRVQSLLASIGMLSARGVDGVYGAGTIAAVAEFQQWVNIQRGEEILPPTGEADALTQAYLEYCQSNNLWPRGTPTPVPTATPTSTPFIPTPTPTPAPTETPTEAPTATPEPTEEPDPYENIEITVDKDSPVESILFMQQMLHDVGLLSEDGVDGKFGRGTTAAILAFQQWFNANQDEYVLPETGQFDNTTRLALEYAVDHEIYVVEPTATPTQVPTAVPTEAPTPTPVPTEVPTPEPTAEPTAEPTPAAPINLLIAFGGELVEDQVFTVTGDSVQVRWAADGDVECYYVYVNDGSGQSVASQEAITSTSFNIRTSLMNPGEVYSLTIAALPAGGTQADLVERTVTFMLPAPEPTDTPEPKPTAPPVTAPRLTLNGAEPDAEGVLHISGETFTINWESEGKVRGYLVRVSDPSGEIVYDNTTSKTSVTARSELFQRGATYTIRVTAYPEGGGDALTTTAKLRRGQSATAIPTAEPTPTPEPTEAPTPTPAPTPSPVPTVAPIGAPVIVVGGASYVEDGVTYMSGDTVIISWSADGAVESYTVYVENQDGNRVTLGPTTDTSRALNTSTLSAGTYTVTVGAKPAYGTDDDMRWSSYRFNLATTTAVPTAVPTQAPTIEPTETPAAPTPVPMNLEEPVTAQSDPQIIQQVQIRLYSLGLLSTEGTEIGALDQKTLQAVVVFQTMVNDKFGVSLPIVDPTDPYAQIDVQTLKALFQVERNDIE